MAAIAFMVLASCNNSSQQTAATDTAASMADTAEMRVQIPNTNCYQHVTGKDTIFLKLEKFPNVVTGSLMYKFHEKDSNEGTLDGKLNGDTLIAEYSFMSEGKQSMRQVAFLISDNVVTEGYADMEEKDGKLIFKNTGKIDFSKGTTLQSIACPVQ